MEPLTYVMALLGCADGSGACSEVRLSNYTFADRTQCERAAEVVLLDSTDIDFPTINARCVSAQQYVAQHGPQARKRLAVLQRFPG